MSLILKGIDLPTKKQKTLIVEIAWDGDVWVDNHDRCELKYNSAIQIPKGHGRLIDGDELRKEFNRTESGYCGGWEFCDKPEDVQFLIDETPTILEAEEADDKNA